jgi:hypothetical protein
MNTVGVWVTLPVGATESRINDPKHDARQLTYLEKQKGRRQMRR